MKTIEEAVQGGDPDLRLAITVLRSIEGAGYWYLPGEEGGRVRTPSNRYLTLAEMRTGTSNRESEATIADGYYWLIHSLPTEQQKTRYGPHG